MINSKALSVAFTSSLKSCAKTKDIDQGIRIHADICNSGLLEKDTYLGTTLVSMYAKCGALVKAAQVLHELPIRNVVSWNALIAGYVHQGQGKEALDNLDRMLNDGLYPNHITYMCILKACAITGEADRGKKFHHDIASQGFLENDVVLGSALVDMYAKCGLPMKAQKAFDELPYRDVVSWSALISGYAQKGQVEKAFECFQRMRGEGLSPNEITYNCLLKVCSTTQQAKLGKKLHDEIVSQGLLEKNAVLGTTLVDMYAKCGVLTEAQKILDDLHFQNVTFWNALIAGYVQEGQGKEALDCFQCMQSEHLSPNAITYACILKACGMTGETGRGEQIHDEILSQGLLHKDVVLGSALVDMYAKCGLLVKARRVLYELSNRNSVSWNSLIGGYIQQGQGKEALDCFQEMRREGISPDAITYSHIFKACSITQEADRGKQFHDQVAREGLLQGNVMLGTTLVDMYCKFGALSQARRVLDELLVRNVASWNAIIGGYVHKGKGKEALDCFQQMQSEGLSPNAITYACTLRACGLTQDAEKGKQIHDQIISQGLLEEDVSLGITLVNMYVKCGVLKKAQQVLNELCVQSVVSWNALIAGYVQGGQGMEALDSFQRMQSEGVSPDAITYLGILKACGITCEAQRGEQIYDEIARQGLLKKYVALGTALVDMFAKCGVLTKAQKVLDELPVRNVVSWNALMVGYVEQGQGKEALDCLQRMRSEGLSPDTVTYLCALKACGITQGVQTGEEMHEEISSQGLLEGDLVLGSALVDMYAKCAVFAKAEQVLNAFPVRNVICWNVLIAGYVQHGQGEKALDCFQGMRSEGLNPDAITYACILKACGTTREVYRGQQIHDEIVSQGLLGKNVVLGSALVDMYAKCGVLTKAHKVLDGLPVRNAASWNALILGYAQEGQGKKALDCFEWMRSEGLSPNVITYAGILKACALMRDASLGQQIHDEITCHGLLDGNVVLGSTLVYMYSKCGALQNARDILGELPVRNVVSWNAVIIGYVEQGQGKEALDCYKQMRDEGLYSDCVTYACLLKACSITQEADIGKQIHDEIVSQGMLANDVVLATILVDMYANCGMLPEAQRILYELPVRNVVSWNALMAGYVQQGQGENALVCSQGLRREGLSPDAVTYACILKACGLMQEADRGEQIHKEIASRGFLEKDVVLGNALVDMYAKCGLLGKAKEALDGLPMHNVVSWNTLIAGYAQEGDCKGALESFERMEIEGISADVGCWNAVIGGYVQQGWAEEALECFESMQLKGASPDAITFLQLLKACCHSGLVDEGHTYLDNMTEHYGIVPGKEHHTCMVNLLGHAGHFDMAMRIIKKMPSSDHPPLWRALMGTCKKWGNVGLGRLAFEHAVQLDGHDGSAYVLMADMNAAVKMEAKGCKAAMEGWYIQL